MGVIKRGILGGFSGKVAGIVGTSWKGIAVIKSMPLSVANPNTAAQQTQRGKFAHAVAFTLLLLTQIVKPMNDRFAIKESGYNLFLKRNIGNFDIDGMIETPDVIISTGKVTAPGYSAATGSTSSPVLSVTMTDTSGIGDALDSDVLFSFAYCVEDKEVAFIDTPATRTDTNVTYTFSGNLKTSKMYFVCAAYRRADGSAVSNTAQRTAIVS